MFGFFSLANFSALVFHSMHFTFMAVCLAAGDAHPAESQSALQAFISPD